MKIGVTIGKFYPFHLGHNYLITEAKKQVDHLFVLVCGQEKQTINQEIRAQWIRFLHPEIEVIEVLDDLPEAPEPWAKRTLEVLGNRKPTIAFTSEDYGELWAKFMGCQHICIDKQREKYPISGTKIRENLSEYWEMLTPLVKAYFAKRICILGVESSGTTTLAKELAQYYQTVWIPEYGRYYWEGRRHLINQEKWNSYEFLQIIKGQIEWENNLATKANKVVLCDTDPLATCVWYRRYLGEENQELLKIANNRYYDLYILTEPDFGYIQDGSRESESFRTIMHQWFIEKLNQKNCHYIIVNGNQEHRMSKAISVINSLLIFPKLLN